MEDLGDGILRVCAILNKHHIDYLVVGGIAVGFHGYFRKSIGPDGTIAPKIDLDLWYNPTYENYFKLLSGLEELGQNVQVFKQEQSPNPKTSFFKFELENLTLDLLPEIKAKLKFNASFRNKEVVSQQGIIIPYINYNDLIKDKEAMTRPKDLEDIRKLEDQRNKSK